MNGFWNVIGNLGQLGQDVTSQYYQTRYRDEKDTEEQKWWEATMALQRAADARSEAALRMQQAAEGRAATAAEQGTTLLNRNMRTLDQGEYERQRKALQGQYADPTAVQEAEGLGLGYTLASQALEGPTPTGEPLGSRMVYRTDVEMDPTLARQREHENTLWEQQQLLFPEQLKATRAQAAAAQANAYESTQRGNYWKSGGAQGAGSRMIAGVPASIYTQINKAPLDLAMQDPMIPGQPAKFDMPAYRQAMEVPLSIYGAMQPNPDGTPGGEVITQEELAKIEALYNSLGGVDTGNPFKDLLKPPGSPAP